MLFGKKSDKKKKSLPPDFNQEQDTDTINNGDSGMGDSVLVSRASTTGFEEETVQQAAPGRAKVLSVTIRDRKTLHAAYMPFVESGGIFVPSSSQYKIGDEVFLLLKLLDSPEQISISGQIVWITPEGAIGRS